MLKRLIIFIGMGFLLTGCVLQSRTAVFSESDGAFLPKELGSQFVMENLDKGVWTKEEGTLTLSPTGHHYLAIDGKKKDTIEALFVPLDKNWWVMQATETPDKPSIYILAELDGTALLLHPLFCADLKKQSTAADSIGFEGEDCYLKDGQGVGYFKTLVTGIEPAKMRMVKAN